MRYPFDVYRLGTPYGRKGSYWKCGYHSGVDFISKATGGDGSVYPIYKGYVSKITKTGSYGNCVYVTHPDGYVSLYAHLKIIYVKKNMPVNEKTVLGVEGATGNVTGRHLHLEVHKGAYHYPSQIDPLKFIEDRLNAKEAVEEVEKQLKIKLNGVEKTVTAIEKDGYNYVKLQDLRDSKIAIGYDKVPTIDVVK